MKEILQQFDIEATEIIPFGTGLINHTWLVKNGNNSYILQQINDGIFKKPELIEQNISLVAKYLEKQEPGYFFASPEPTIDGHGMFRNNDGYFRVFPFVEGSHTIDVVQTPEQAYAAAAAFGRFTKILSGFDAGKLNITLPSFHDLSLRYRQFEEALQKGNEKRIAEATDLIGFLQSQSAIVEEYEKMKIDTQFKLRVTHHDTKISNVLFDDNDKAICVIDLDTIMPGYFISDVGDMMRTYLCPVSEEEADTSKIEVRIDFYKAIVDGYYSEMKGELSATEKEHFFYAGKFMIYMQALRFLTDYINNDVYYGARYEKHNFVRARNQVVLLRRLFEKEHVLD